MLFKMKKLKSKMLFFVLIMMIIPLSIVAIIAQSQSQRVIRAQSLITHTRLLDIGMEKLESSYKQLNDIFLSIYLNDNFQSCLLNQAFDHSYTNTPAYSELMKNVFLSAISSRSDLYSIIYIDNGNHLIYTTRDEAGDFSNYEKCILSPHYIELLNHENWTENAVVIPTEAHMPLKNTYNSPKMVYTIARRIINTKNQFEIVGTMFLTVDLSELQHLSQIIQTDISSRTIISDSMDNIIYDSLETLTGQRLPEEIICNTEKQGIAEIVQDNRSNVMLTKKSDKTGWCIITIIPETLYVKEALTVSSSIMITAILTIIIAIFITLNIAGSISKPTEQLAKTMNSSDLQHLHNRAQIQGNDEIAQLGHSFNRLMDNLENSINNEYIMAIRQKDTVIKALQEQINPHFLYNVLQSISSMASVNNVPEIVTMSNSLAAIMRYSIRSTEKYATLKEELDHVENYLKIQKIRFGNRLNYQFIIPAYTMNYILPRVTLQPMAENAIVHGFENRKDPGHIIISARTYDNMLIIEIADDGCGINEENLKVLQQSLLNQDIEIMTSGKNIGLYNLNARLKLLFENQGKLELESDVDAGTISRIIIPIK